mgnify:CR=1 FL=1
MNLTPEQKQAVASWIAAGDSLSAVQNKLSSEFKISLTYRDVRFLVDDLNLELKDTAPKIDASDVTKASVPPAAPAAAPDGDRATLDDEDEIPADNFPEDDATAAPAGAGSVSVEIDRVVRPGAVVSGSVTFSDGVSGKWALDQYGRLMLDTGKPGYQPSAPDVQAFQRELSTQLQRHGF